VEIEKNVVAELRVQTVAHDVQGRVRVQGFGRGNWLPKVELGWLRGGRGRWGRLTAGGEWGRRGQSHWSTDAEEKLVRKSIGRRTTCRGESHEEVTRSP
jgi:hypothetical protein